MSRRGDKNRDIKLRGQFITAFVETRRTPAWKALSMGARELYMTLKVHHFVGFKNNNGHIFLSERKAMEEMGVRNRESIRRWYRELQHYGFIVMTSPGSLGVAGKGKAPQWRLTELETPLADSKEPTLDYKKWDGTPFNGNQAWRGRGQKPKKQNPGRETTSRVDAKQRPVLDAKQRPPHPRSGRETTSISAPHPGRETTSISRLTTGGGAGGPLVKKEQGKVPWSTPALEPVPGDYDRATLANADIFDTGVLATLGNSNG
jgi:hypothetical protein